METTILCGVSFVAGGLVVGFWSSKIWPWFKSEGSAAETKAGTKLDEVKDAIEKKL